MNPGGQNPTLGQPSTPEEDIALQAIESLDVEDEATPAEPSVTPAASPEIPEADNTPEPVISNPISDIKAMPPAADEPDLTPTAETPVSSAVNNSLAAANSEPAPATETFQPFAQQKPAHNPVKIVLIVLLALIVLGGGGYFGWQYYQSTLTTTPAATSEQQPAADDQPALTDSEAAVNEDISEVENLLESLSDDDLGDDTLSDDALYN